jgi:pimeloyl-ACP methyl ester carboxylesterase
VSIAIDEGAGRSVLLVHGQPGSGADWKPLARLLSADHRVVATDRPGWGDDEREATGLAANAADLAAVAETSGLTPPVTVAGHSLGGGIALELALSRPELVGALVLLGSIGVERALSRLDRLLAVPAVGDPVIRAGLAATRRGIATGRRLTRSTTASAVAMRANRFPSVRALVWLEAQPIGRKERTSFLVEQRALLDETPEIERGLPRLEVPTAVVHGTSDHIVPLEAARALAERIPGAELVWLKGEGHLVPFERPELIAPIVRRYSAMAGGS